MNKEKYENIGFSEYDIKTIKYEKRFGYIFALLILSFGGLFNIYSFAIGSFKTSWDNIIFTDFGICTLSIATLYFMNKNLNRDLNYEITEITREQIQTKKEENSYKGGSGAMWLDGQDMKSSIIYYLIVNGYKYEVKKELYEMVNKNDFVEFRYSKYSKTLLEIKKMKSEII